MRSRRASSTRSSRCSADAPVARLLRDVGEHAWIARLVGRLGAAARDRRVLVGPGDDAAAIRPGRRPLLLTTDALIEGVHFRAGWAAPSVLGRRAFAVNASDLAAMGGEPTFALLALEAPGRLRTADLDALVRGFARAAARAGARLVGGNLVAGSHLAITATLLGEASGPVVGRAGARPGDALYVTGTLGRAGVAVRALRAGRRTPWPLPPLRLRAGRLLAPSGVGAEILAARVPVAPACRRALGDDAPRFAATAGEDYELLVAVPARAERALARLRTRLGCRLTRIGRIVAGRPVVRVLDAAGQPVATRRAGFDHFR
ncbi:MAG: thiamine-monophosphate kinase [Deltaproteobacteria bacterium]|nr:MAG: thiamine-monophosphate kinase [Deltaproteobacteria bacterium]